MREIKSSDTSDICRKYQNGSSIEEISKEYSIGDRRVRKLLIDNGVSIRDTHAKTISEDTYIEDNLKRFPEVEGKHYVAVSKYNGKKFSDYLNKSGSLTSMIKNDFNVEIPSLYKRKKFFHDNGYQWHEQWFDIICEDDENVEYKHCPYCDWKTKDIENKSGMFMTHIEKCHEMTISEHLKNHPEDAEYFKKQNRLIKKECLLTDKNNYVICPICGEKFEKITYWHVSNKHGITYEEFRKMFPLAKVISENMIEESRSSQKLMNLHVSKNRFISKYEKEIQDFLIENDIDFETNRQILSGREIDILIPSKMIGIEFDGLKWHTEWFGKKNHAYHIEKTKICNKNGYGLIHIFEDEYVNHKEIVYSKLSHILGISKSTPIMARKCDIREIYSKDAEIFLNENHIQGFSKSSVYIGAFYQGELVSVMSFKNGNIKNVGWELTRFATSMKYRIVGIGGKLLKFFIKEYDPYEIISFADRRWTISIEENLYTKLGFTVEKINNPDYRYYNEKINRFERVHKMKMSKKALSKKYGFPMTMTETEMAKELGYDRIWDCGLVKYVWRKQ